MKPINNKGITILSLIILVLIVGGLVMYGPKAYEYVLNQNIKRLVTANVEKIESEIRSELVNRHPVHIWNNINYVISSVNIMNPITRQKQTQNGWDKPGEVVVTFDGINTFRLEGIGRDGYSLRLNIVIQRPN
jgi:hypothetical protein